MSEFWPCDECGRMIPSSAGLVTAAHAEYCSLHPEPVDVRVDLEGVTRSG